MDLQYLNWKIFLENPAETEVEEWFKVLNDWIPDSPEVFLDVADYKHVSDGPVLVLVGHYLNLSLDATHKRPGLLLDYKQPLEGTNAEKLKHTLLSLLKAAKRLTGEAHLAHKPRFKGGELQLTVNSRAVAQNTPAALEAVKPDLVKVLSAAYGEGGFTLEHVPDPRLRFSVTAQAKTPFDLDELLKRLA
jgi:hypothetical protein